MGAMNTIKQAIMDGEKLGIPCPVFCDILWDRDIPQIVDNLNHFIIAITQTDTLRIIHDFCEYGFVIVKTVRIEDGCIDSYGIELSRVSYKKETGTMSQRV